MRAKSLAMLMLSYEDMSNKKLQKMCYYAYAWYKTIFNESIADVTFEAWVHGPVSREIYYHYKDYGWGNIPRYYGFIDADERVIGFCNKIVELYGSFSADELEERTHREDPWLRARHGISAYESSSVSINDYDIIEFYSKDKKTYTLLSMN